MADSEANSPSAVIPLFIVTGLPFLLCSGIGLLLGGPEIGRFVLVTFVILYSLAVVISAVSWSLLRGLMNENTVTVRNYRSEDAEELMRLFYGTVHGVNIADYTQAQVEAWAPADGMDVERWRARFARKRPLVAVEDNVAVGFAELEPDGHIDCFYVHGDRQRRGVGSRLMAALVEAAHEQGLERLYSEVSITARPFFERHGFTTVREQEVHLRGETLTNFVIEKHLTSPPEPSVM